MTPEEMQAEFERRYQQELLVEREAEFDKRYRQELDDTVGAGRRKAALSGTVTGLVGGTIGLPGDIRELQDDVVKATGLPAWVNILSPFPRTPNTKEIVQGIDNLAGTELNYEPKTAEEGYAKAVSGGIAGGLLPGGKINTLTRMMLGGLSGATGEAASNLTGGNAAAGFAGTLLPQVLAGWGAARRPQVVKAVGDMVQGLPEGELTTAAARAAEAEKATGVRPLLSQATTQPTQLSGITQEIMQSPVASKLLERLNQQTQIGNQRIDELVGVQAPATMFGQEDANRVLNAGKKTFSRADDVASQLSKRLYEKGKKDVIPTDIDVLPGEDNPFSRWTREVRDAYPEGGNPQVYHIPPVTVRDISRRLRERADQLQLDPQVTKSGKAIHSVADKIDALGDKYPEGVPAGVLEALYREERIAGTAATGAQASRKDKQRELAYKSISGIINDALKLDSPGLREGKDRFSRSVAASKKKLEDSALSDMFPATARETGHGNFDQMGVVLRESSRFKPDDIAFVAKQLRRADPQAFPTLVKQQWSKVLDEVRSPAAGRTPQQSMNDWANTVAGPKASQKRANFNEIIKQNAINAGANPEAAVTGADKLIDALYMFSADRGGLGKINPVEMRRGAGRTPAGEAVKSINFAGRWSSVQALERHLYKKVYNQIADALLTPEGVKKLEEIAAYDYPKEQLAAFVRGLWTTSAASQAQ